MKKLELDEIHAKLLELLIEFDSFCREHDIKYTLGGGTMLGAVRHKGFIPWDDDIDVNLYRPDYDKLIIISQELNNDDRKFLTISNRTLYRNFSKYVRTDCKVIDDGFQDKNCPWIGMDIFPIDDAPEDINKYKKQIKNLHFLRELLLISVTEYNTGGTKKKRIIKNILRPFTRIIGSYRIAKKMDKISQKYNNQNSKYVAAMSGMYGLRERWEKEHFLPVIEADFESVKSFIYKNYDEYLSNLYGDYMKIPPENKRKYTTAKVYVD